jgi:serpin B
MRQLVEIVSALAAIAVLFSACAPRPSASVAQSSLQRVTDPAVPLGDEATLVQGNNTFALDLYRSLRKSNGNLAYSPYSLSIALAMPYAGARGDTESQMAQTLHYTLPQDRLHPAFNQLDLNLAAEAQTSDGAPNPLKLNIANAVWGEQTFSFLPDYLALLARNYGAGIQLADFVNHADAVRQQINDWVSQKTADKIKDLIPSGAVDATTRMVLVNAIYFKADWLEQFDPNHTSDAPFYLLDGSQLTSKQMSNHFSGVPYASGNGWQAVELAYEGNTAAMDILVPDAGTFQDFESSLDASKLDAITKSLQPTSLQLALPKFTFRSSFDLDDQLASLGMTDAFDPNAADFSGMTGKRDLFISKLLHQAYVAVDEKGTEAAAATAVIMAPSSIMIPDKTLTIDHPFIFAIRDLKSGQILFLGRVLDPSK